MIQIVDRAHKAKELIRLMLGCVELLWASGMHNAA